VIKFLLFLVAALIASPAVGQVITDGDTLKIGGTIYRLWGIDDPEAKQTCPDGWPAGSLAATRLQALTAGRSIVCQEKDRDRYGRIVAICRASGEDLGAIMVIQPRLRGRIREGRRRAPRCACARLRAGMGVAGAAAALTASARPLTAVRLIAAARGFWPRRRRLEATRVRNFA
jgi:hypothetical protein